MFNHLTNYKGYFHSEVKVATQFSKVRDHVISSIKVSKECYILY